MKIRYLSGILASMMAVLVLCAVAVAQEREAKKMNENNSKAQEQPASQEAFFAGGCFWGVEYHFGKMPGVLSAESGYMGGRTSRPSYQEVCSGTTGHIETVRVVFDPARTTFLAVARRFFEIHDPTQVDRQGPDIGEQYRSVVFVTDDGQRAVMEDLIRQLVARGYEVATRIEPVAEFWPAEDYHQDYYVKKGALPYCHAEVRRFED